MEKELPLELEKDFRKHLEIKCVVMSHLFDGYTIFVKLDHIESKDDVIAIIVASMYSLFQQYNLTGLITHLESTRFDIPVFDLKNIYFNPNEILYVQEVEDD